MDDLQDRPKRGRPSRFNDQLAEVILDLAERGMTDEQIAEYTGISVRTLFIWKAKHPDFMHALKDAKGIADDMIEHALFQRALGYRHKATKMFFDSESLTVVKEEYEEVYPPDVRAAQFWLRNRRPKRWRREEEATKSESTNFTLAYKLDEE